MVTKEQLLNDPKYRKMSVKELAEFINNTLEVSMDLYLMLEGRDSYIKAQILYDKWHSEPSLDGLLKQKEELEKKIEELKSKFKVGDWVCCNDNGLNDSAHIEFKAVTRKGDVLKIDHFSKQSSADCKVAVTKEGRVVYIEKYAEEFRLATPEEIKTHLIKEAERRGFKEGVRFNCARTNVVSTCKETYNGFYLEWQYDKEEDTLSRMCHQYLYSKGKWAEILKSFTFGGKEVKRIRDGFDNDVFECDGKTFNAKSANGFVIYAKHFGVDLDSSVKIHCTTGTWREIENIVNNLK